jgi:hypothetical protein
MVIKNDFNNKKKSSLYYYLNNIHNGFTSYIEKHNLKVRIIKFITFITLFILIFDKATMLLLLYLANRYRKHKQKKNENFNNNNNNNNNLVTTIFEPSNNSVVLLSKVFKHPELNYNSYNNIKIDPTKVLFEDNKFLPECCFYNSEYSSSKGCPCITGDQQNYLNTRGTNKSYTSFIQSNNDYKNKYFSPTLAYQGAVVPFKTNDDKFITGYEPLTADKKNEFNRLINMY